jgi:dienelactone hydrolase
MSAAERGDESLVHVAAGSATLEGDLSVPPGARGLVLFAHGSGSSRHSPRNRHVAAVLRRAGFATLLTDLLTPEEEAADRQTAHLRFDIGLLAERLIGVTDWWVQRRSPPPLAVGYFGASTGAAAALVAAAARPDVVVAVVARGGRPDLAGESLRHVQAPTLLIVGGQDVPVIGLNQEALEQLSRTAARQFVIVPGATHLFEEPGALDEVARLAAQWFARYLPGAAAPRP